MEENIKITRLPDMLNPNKMMEEKIFRTYGVCPFCGENKEWDFRNGFDSNGVEILPIVDSWYGKHNESGSIFSLFNFREKDMYWKRDHFECHTCGTQWKSPPYPKNIGGYES